MLNPLPLIKVGEHNTSAFSIERGVKQGCPISGNLFNIFVNDILEFIEPIHVPGVSKNLRGLLQADDLVILGDSPEQLQSNLDALSRWAATFEMSFNNSKCGIMQFYVPDMIHHFTLSGDVVPIVESYVYLGVIFDPSMNFRKFVSAKAASLNKMTSLLQPVLSNSSIPIRTKLRLIKVVLIGHVCYGLELLAGSKARVGPIQTKINAAARIALGGPKHTAVTGLLNDAGLFPIDSLSRMAAIRLFRKAPYLRSSLSCLVGTSYTVASFGSG